MSAEKANPFARWSRLKQESRQTEAPREPESPVEPASDDDARSGDPQVPPSEAAAGLDAAQPPEPLPLIEDLTPESDLSAFLRSDIPATLKNTALRKMWSLDPAIRDYVGPADYAWDFNTPGSMRGFGALEAGKAVADFLSTVGGSNGEDRPAEPESEPLQQAAATLDDGASAPEAADIPEHAAEAPETTEPAPPAQNPVSPQDGPSSNRAAADAAQPTQSPRRSLSRHGGAVPR